jgi:hypothetical protein
MDGWMEWLDGWMDGVTQNLTIFGPNLATSEWSVDCRSVPTRGGKNLAKFGGRHFQLLLLSLFTVLFGVEVGASGNRVGRLLI